MSTRKGGAAKGAPKHQNTFAFRANKHSKKSQEIRALPNMGLCRRCTEIIDWKKKYQKYKPLTTPGKCNTCHQKRVNQAYHTICDPCARDKQICAKCCKEPPARATLLASKEEEEAQVEAEEELSFMRERERRTALRRLRKGEDGDDDAGGEDDDSASEEDGALAELEPGATVAGQEELGLAAQG